MNYQSKSLLTLLTVGIWLSCLLPAVADDMKFDVPGGSRTVTIDVTDENVRTVLYNLSQQAGFNLMMDESVVGNVTIDLSNVSVNDALGAVAALSDIEVVKQSGNIYLAISKDAARQKNVSRQLSKVIKINYGNAERIATTLNASLFVPTQGQNGTGGSNTASAATAPSAGAPGQMPLKVSVDNRTNSVVIVGTAKEIAEAEEAIRQLDQPRLSKTFYLSHANALNVASILAGGLFNDGTNLLSLSGGGTTGSANSIRVDQETVKDSTDVSNFSSSATNGGSAIGPVTLRASVKTTASATVSNQGVKIIPDTRGNSVTIFGTAEQIAMAEAQIPILDAQPAQVAIEASLVEVTDEGIKDLGSQWGISDGKLQFGFNNQAVEGVRSLPVVGNLIGMPTVSPTDPNTNGSSGINFSNDPAVRSDRILTQVRTLVTKNKAKVLANPTVVATHDTEAIVSIVDEIIRRVTVEIDSQGFATQTVEFGEAGIVLNILPKIGEDGTLTMRLRPSVTSIRGEEQDSLGNVITLLSRRDMLTQAVRIKDGETLVIGGLINEQERAIRQKLPIGGDLPVVGAMFRASQRTGKRSELVLLVTPHILNKTTPTPVHAVENSMDAAIGAASTNDPAMDARLIQEDSKNIIPASHTGGGK